MIILVLINKTHSFQDQKNNRALYQKLNLVIFPLRFLPFTLIVFEDINISQFLANFHPILRIIIHILLPLVIQEALLHLANKILHR
jgi:hypothetical protein